MINVGINGFGRIGRLILRIILKEYKDKIKVTLINTSGRIDISGWVHLFKYDTAYGKYEGNVNTRGDNLIVDGVSIPITGIREPENISWDKYKTQIVIESTGVFRKETDLKKHFKNGVKRVILSAPPKEGNIPMYVIGVNENKMGKEKIFSCASCTTNCVAPVTKVIEENFGIEKALMSTIHAYTSDQRLLDGSHKDLRRSRSAAQNIIPTTTGAAKATGKVYPQVEGIFDGIAIRVPVITGSLTDFTFLTKKKTSAEKVNQAFQKAAQGKLKGILGTTEEPIVSSDIIGMNYSALVDLPLTKVIGEDLVKVIAWYDNEWGYAKRLVEEILLAI
ncbi:type I glyceraldehyde-3-phosphate dehydrogenase [Candidatus Beckwithbacteria bacterium CG10_big_fil_rev_8_21_14_0_10_34_10]|uniref:Type I glyceraldehyde-3-phosphate dehydrogenase n=1 Tax=Candidatus Beckwithbacteria bacterium CG10_big_fil_rev_8_21_14_0_10_34_10 TaxID=1974495 RepID=A0A2H0W875_9BACT|nr:MAG: type I glyceraldehyde-3-phosphate dehydrogenase [Candidatus Beckwithbacteria bacterium CG10_big_fil_rev_8_21_14_0_10_34_10]